MSVYRAYFESVEHARKTLKAGVEKPLPFLCTLLSKSTLLDILIRAKILILFLRCFVNYHYFTDLRLNYFYY